MYREYFDMPVVSISDSQRHPLPWIGWSGTVYHGLPKDLYHFQSQPGQYLAFLGRICPEKRPDRAIEIAERTGVQLKIAAKIDETDEAYFQEEIKPLLERSSSVEFIGEINEREKDEFLGNALALLFPINWPEPFGLVLIEAMACGTPIIAFRNGSVPEIVDDGRTGFVVDTLEEAIMAIQKIDSIDRRICRAAFEERFTARRMAQDYLAIYEKGVLVMAENLCKYATDSTGSLARLKMNTPESEILESNDQYYVKAKSLTDHRTQVLMRGDLFAVLDYNRNIAFGEQGLFFRKLGIFRSLLYPSRASVCSHSARKFAKIMRP
jgi:hypothetical protein